MAKTSEVFPGYVTADGKTVKLQDRESFARFAKTFAGKDIEIELRKRKTKRSIDQNKWLWGRALPLIADSCGYDEHEHEELHYELLAVRFGTKEIPPRVPGGPPMVMPAQTTSGMTVEEFSDYMEWLVRYAAQSLGVVVPLPSERTEAA